MLDTSSSFFPDLCSIDPRYRKDSLGCRILSPIQISTSSLWVISRLPKSHLRYSVFSRLTLRPLSSRASLQFSSLVFKPSADSKTSTISSTKTKHHGMSSCMVDTNNVDASMVDAAKVKAQVRNKRTWTAEEDQKLIEALMVLHATGKYGAENGFKPGYNQAVQNLLDISIPNSGLKADPHIKSRLKTWRTKFSIMHDMVFGSNTSGFGWDTEKCVLTAPYDVWDSYLKVQCF
ncbi:hypothetical protein Tco_0231291 [Tanacetum coccineum]